MNPIQWAANKRPFSVREYVLPVSAGVTLLLSLYTTYFIPLSLMMAAVTVLMILDRLGKGVILRELIALYAMFTCLIMPAMGYTYYTRDNALSRIWVRWMPIPEEVYFGFALPALAAFTLTLCWPVTTQRYSDYGRQLSSILDRIRKQLAERPKVSISIMVVGVAAEVVSKFLPGALQFVITLVFWGAFAGVLYLFYTPGLKRKTLVLLAFAAFILFLALQSGMFTIVAYMGITMFSFFFIGKKFALWKKLIVFILGCAFLLVLQASKGRYRSIVYHQGSDDKAALFGSIFTEQLSNFSGYFAVDAFFPFYYRTNQGFNVSLVMRTFPAHKSFDYGTNLATNFASAFVPRALWPDKPEAGGKFNMKYYTGIQLSEGWSTNVGPLGEAYGSFGVEGGILYMFFLGMFMRWVYKSIFKFSQKTPLIIFWIPVMFYEVTYSAETDSLQIFNSLIKSAFFLYLLFKIKPDWFILVKKTNLRALRRKARPDTPPATT